MTAAEKYESDHLKRYQQSLDWIAPIADKAQRILDVGGQSPFTKMIDQRWPGKLLPYFYGDVRNGFYQLDAECDLVLAMEVIEHVEEATHSGVQDEWHGTGPHIMLASCFQNLRPGGHLFLTTPNACSITVIHHALNLVPPMLYRPHIREYSPYELDELVRANGFEILRRETLDVWLNAISAKAHSSIEDFIRRRAYPEELRGEDIFLLARRPVESKTKA